MLLSFYFLGGFYSMGRVGDGARIWESALGAGGLFGLLDRCTVLNQVDGVSN